MEKLKKMLSLLLAVITVVSAVAGMTRNMAEAASSFEIGDAAFAEPGIDVFGDGHTSLYNIKLIEGGLGYCIERVTDIHSFDTYGRREPSVVDLTSEQRKLLSYALVYGYQANNTDLSTHDKLIGWTMTQTMVWLICENHFDNVSMRERARDCVAGNLASQHGVNATTAQRYFNALYENIRLGYDKTNISFGGVRPVEASTITLHWNESNKRYQEIVTDTNNVLSSFNLDGVKAFGISYEKRSTNAVVFYSNTPCTTGTITFEPLNGTYAANHSTTSIVYYGNPVGDQPLISFDFMNSDPIKGYVKFNTETSSLRIRKVSSDNGQPLNTVTFDIYSDAACRDLVKSVTTKTIDGEDGAADVTGLGVGQTYYVLERAGAGATNHRHLDNPVAVTIKAGTNTIEIKNDRVPVTIILNKTEAGTDKPVAGAVYSLYAKTDIKAAAGDTVLFHAGDLVADFPATDDKGQARLDNLYIGKYYVKEKTAPSSGIYALDTTEYAVDASASAKDFASNAVITKTLNVSEPSNLGCIKVIKTSEKTNTPLAGAVFGIYKNAACTDLVQELTTGRDGTATSKSSIAGTYYVKELTAPDGYVKTTEVKNGVVTPVTTTNVEFTNKSITVEISKTSVTGDCPEIPGATLVIKDVTGKVVEQWMSEGTPHRMDALPVGDYTLTELRAPFGYQVAETVKFTVLEKNEIQTVTMKDAETYGKIIINKTDSLSNKPLAGVEFTVYKKSANGSLERVAVLTTDRNGHAESELLPIGTYGTEGFTSYIQYVLKETKTLPGYVLDRTPHNIEFTYVDDKTPVINKTFNLKNEPIPVEISKTSITGSCPEIPGATLVIKDAEGKVIEQWVSENTPHRMNALPAGDYTLTELRAPFGYQVAETVNFTVLEKNEIQTVTMKDAETYGKIIIDKTDEATGRPLAGVEFTVYQLVDAHADGDVENSEDADAVEYQEIAKIVTDENGHAESELLPIGTYGTEGFTSYIQYMMKETKAAAGYVIDETKYDVEFTYIDDKTPVIEKVYMIGNDEAYGKIILNKVDQDSEEPLAGVEFTIYKRTESGLDEVGILVTDERGHAESELLPIGTFGVNGFEESYEYVVKETKALSGYVLDSTEHSVVFEYQGDKVSVIDSVINLENDYTKVEISKTSVTGTCPEIAGATLVVKDAEGKVIEQWVSENTPHRIDRLPAGTYTLTELRAPFGYVVAETVEFTVEETGEIQTVEMKDDEAYGKIIINKTDSKTGKPLKGVTFEIRLAESIKDATGKGVLEKGKVVATLVTDKDGHAESELLPIGTFGKDGFVLYIQYEIVEVKALDGYTIDKTVHEIKFEYVDDKTPVIEKSFNLKNEPVQTPPDTPRRVTPPQTGDNRLVLFWGAMMLMAGVSIFLLIKKHQHH